jgi:hypothetical protein
MSVAKSVTVPSKKDFTKEGKNINIDSEAYYILKSG